MVLRNGGRRHSIVSAALAIACLGLSNVANAEVPSDARVKVCRDGCVVVRSNDRGKHTDLTPAATHAIGISSTGQPSIGR